MYLSFLYLWDFWSQCPEVERKKKMSRKNGKKLLIEIAVGAVVVKAVRDVMKAKKQEEELRSALDDF